VTPLFFDAIVTVIGDADVFWPLRGTLHIIVPREVFPPMDPMPFKNGIVISIKGRNP
jgi:hypothetical protein